MADFISLICPSCGSKLQITNQIEQFYCASCGNAYVVNRSGGIISIAPIVNGIKKVQTGVDKTASELAIKRIKLEIQDLEKDLRSAKNEKKQNINYGLNLGISGLVFFVLLLVLAGDEGIGCIGLSFLISIAGFAIAYFTYTNGDSGAIESISSQINQKQKELRYHQKIVNKY